MKLPGSTMISEPLGATAADPGELGDEVVLGGQPGGQGDGRGDKPPGPFRWLGRYACGWLTLTSQVMPNWSTTMPNSSPQGCFCIGIVVFPLADSLCQ
jgi:hypothetical protein